MCQNYHTMTSYALTGMGHMYAVAYCKVPSYRLSRDDYEMHSIVSKVSQEAWKLYLSPLENSQQNQQCHGAQKTRAST